VLGDKLANVLDRGELTLVRNGDAVRVKYFDKTFPLDARAVARLVTGARVGAGIDESTPSDAERDAELTDFSAGSEGRERMRELLEAQPYALASWRRADKEISYRRFFDVNELIGIRQEDPAVFAATHARILEWVSAGEVDGLRIDHIDGLSDPLGYLQRLRAEVERRRRVESAESYPIVVEKILSGDERLRDEWPVQGTTGYEFLNELEAIFIDPVGAAAIDEVYRVHRHRRTLESFAEVAREAKTLILHTSLAVDVHRLARLLQPIARRDAATAKLTPSVLADGITAFAVALPVYRTYIDARGVIDEDDRRVIERALADARAQVTEAARTDEENAQEGSRRSPAQTLAALDLLRRALLDAGSADDPERLAFIARLQQSTGPATAKGVEDTALYRYVPLLSRNEVGGDPGRRLDDAVARLHANNAARARRWPATLLCTNTHDTKRSADLRARLDVLSELPRLWERYVSRWRRAHRTLRREVGGVVVPDANTEYLLYQTLVGIWPLARPETTQETHDDKDETSLRERVDRYMQKAMREAKTHTKWTEPNEDHEKAVAAFTATLLEGEEGTAFRADLGELAQRITRPGLWNALARALVHLTSPGTPDIYQGDELWNFSLVDPDNRRPVDFGRRAELLGEIERRYAADSQRMRLLEVLVERAEDGRIKLLVTTRALQARREHEALFTRGEYRALEVRGAHAAHVFAFARMGSDGQAALTIVPRLTVTAAPNGQPPAGTGVWGDTVIVLPPELADRRWRCAIAGHEVSSGGELPVGETLEKLPAALMVG
jgi:(1->4)-alpha-D-glucan 1-alpha-D-glucosylmutase